MIIVIIIVVAVIVVVVAIVVFIVVGCGCVDVVDVVEPVVTMDTRNQPQPHDMLRVGSNNLEKTKILSRSKPPSTNHVVCG